MRTAWLALVLIIASAVLAPPRSLAQCVGSGCDVLPPPTSREATLSGISSAELLWPAAPPSFDGLVERPYLRRGRDMGLLALSLTLLTASGIGSLLIGIGDELALNCSPGTCDSWPWAFVPIAGGVLAGTVSMNGPRSSTTAGVAMGSVTAIVGAVGLVLLLFTVHGYTEDIVPSASIGALRIDVLPYASESGGGLSLAVRL